MAGRSFDKKREINGVLYLAAAVILMVAYYLPRSRSGWLGHLLLHGGLGLLGSVALALPLLFIYMALDYLLEKELKLTRRRFAYVFLILIGLAAFFHLVFTRPDAIYQLSLNEMGQARASEALKLAWHSGINPDLISSKNLSGGFLGALLGLALQAIAGQIGSFVLLFAFLISLIILLFNVSFSKVFGQTAKVIQKTGLKMDEAVRQRAEIAAEHKKARADYDILLQEEEEAEPELDQPGIRPGPQKYSLLASLKKMFQPPEALAEEIKATEVQAPISQPAPYDLRLPDPAETASPADLTETDSVELPAAEDDLVDSREQWTDRTETSPEVTVLTKQSKPISPGDQIGIELPYQAPPLHLLRDDKEGKNNTVNRQLVNSLGLKLEQTLASFGIEAKVVNYTTGPTITRFELSPGPGVKVSRIVNLSDDIALNLAALGVRIEAPIPGKSAIGIEIPNKETELVLLRGILESPEFGNARSPLTAALGRDIQGFPILCDLARMPHLLIAGATGSGKSVCINSILISILYRSSPDDVRMLLIDPKVVELSVYQGIPHLLSPVVTDPKKAANTLNWAVVEMTRRYAIFAEKSVRDINSYRLAATAWQQDNPDADPAVTEGGFEKLPLILLVIDELSDLMATAPNEVENSIARLTAMARAAGIHLIIATQRPSVDVITGVIKANIPSRVAFAVASQVDSRTILDMAGAEKLLGKGDMLYFPQNVAKPLRGQGAFITDAEVEKVLAYLKTQHAADYDESVSEAIMQATANGEDKTSDFNDELLPQALDLVVETGYASVSLLQRRLNVGYPRAARLVDSLHDRGYIGPFDGSKPRKILISQAEYDELKAKQVQE